MTHACHPGFQRMWPFPARIAAGIVAASLLVGACGSSSGGTLSPSSGPSGTSASQTGNQLIEFLLPFPCGLNDYAKNACAGAKAAGDALPAGFTFDTKTGLDYADVPAFNALIQNTLQLKPAGLVLFANSPSANTPFLNQACAQGAKVVYFDASADGVTCAVSHVSVPTTELGQKAAAWLIAHPPANGSKKVAIVSQQPGQFLGNDERVKGFTDAAVAGGFQVVQVLATTNALDETRNKVTNMLTAHPDLGAIFSANGPMGEGTEQAVVAAKANVVLLATDGNLPDIQSVLKGTVGVNIAFSSYQGGKAAVEYMVKALQGQAVPAETFMDSLAIDKTNAQAFLDAGGMR